MAKYQFDVTIMHAPVANPTAISTLVGSESANTYAAALRCFLDREENKIPSTSAYRAAIVRNQAVGDDRDLTRFFMGPTLTPQTRVMMFGKKNLKGTGKAHCIATLNHNGATMYLHTRVFDGQAEILIADIDDLNVDETDPNGNNLMTVSALRLDTAKIGKTLPRKFFSKFDPSVVDCQNEIVMTFAEDPYAIDGLIKRAASFGGKWWFFPDVKTTYTRKEMQDHFDGDENRHKGYHFFFERQGDAMRFKLGASTTDVSF